MPEEEASIPERFVATALDPEQQALTSELRAHLESAFDDIPEIYRSVFILRVVEGLDTAETAECLGINGDAVKTRLRRARALLRTEMLGRAGLDSADVFRFHLSRCDRVVASVSTRLHLPAPLKPQCDCPGEFCRSFG